jgi:hypothetical protein
MFPAGGHSERLTANIEVKPRPVKKFGLPGADS